MSTSICGEYVMEEVYGSGLSTFIATSTMRRISTLWPGREAIENTA